MKSLTGIVKSNKTAQTVIVEVTNLWQHPVYKKRVKRTKRYMAHNEIELNVGDTVLLSSTRPLSKLKRWKVEKVVATPRLRIESYKPVAKKKITKKAAKKAAKLKRTTKSTK
jgi:small subunit ribosomal protein S17